MRTAVITHYRRSPFHFASKGALAKVRPDDLAGQVIAKLVADSGIDANDRRQAADGPGGRGVLARILILGSGFGLAAARIHWRYRGKERVGELPADNRGDLSISPARPSRRAAPSAHRRGWYELRLPMQRHWFGLPLVTRRNGRKRLRTELLELFCNLTVART